MQHNSLHESASSGLTMRNQFDSFHIPVEH